MYINKVLIVIASYSPGNIYDKKEKFFHNIDVDYDVEICCEEVSNTQRNFKKWWNSYLRNDTYCYYMFLHDDCRGFKPNWLDVMLEVLSQKDVDAVCHQLYSPGGYPGKYNNPPWGVCNCTDEVSMYGNNESIKQIIWDILRDKFGDSAKFNDLAGGEQMLLPNYVMKSLESVGGIPVPKDVKLFDFKNAGPICERVFCGYINSLGYNIKDCRVNGKPPFLHSTIIEETCTDFKKDL